MRCLILGFATSLTELMWRWDHLLVSPGNARAGGVWPFFHATLMRKKNEMAFENQRNTILNLMTKEATICLLPASGCGESSVELTQRWDQLRWRPRKCKCWWNTLHSSMPHSGQRNMKWLLKTSTILSSTTWEATTRLLLVVAVRSAEPVERWDHFVSPGSAGIALVRGDHHSSTPDS